MFTHIRAVHRVTGRPGRDVRSAIFTLVLAAVYLPAHAWAAENSPSASTAPPAGSTLSCNTSVAGTLSGCTPPQGAGQSTGNAKPAPGAAPAATPPATAPTPANPVTPQRSNPRKVARGALFWQWLLRTKGA